jgi:hypothetical protein
MPPDHLNQSQPGDAFSVEAAEAVVARVYRGRVYSNKSSEQGGRANAIPVSQELHIIGGGRAGASEST